MSARLLQGLSVVLIACPIWIHCDISTYQFVYLVSNISIFPNEKVSYIEKSSDKLESSPSKRCMVSCIRNPGCFMFCHTDDGICTLGQHNTVSNNPLSDVTNSSSPIAYDCYINRQYFDNSPEENALLLGNESVAVNKTAKHSSVYGQFKSYMALDGDRHAKFWDPPKTCFHSEDSSRDVQPYMVIDMAATYLVIAFNITNRADDTTYKRLHDIEIRVGFQPYNNLTNAIFQQNTPCIVYNDVVDSLLLFKNCDQPVIGRYISLQILRFCPVATNKKCLPNEGNKNVISICELDIFALLIGY